MCACKSICGKRRDARTAGIVLTIPTLTADAMTVSFAEGEGRIALDDVKCRGDEASLLSCPQLPLTRPHNCAHKEDVGVQCSGT